MKTVHLVIPDLFLPEELSAELTKGMALPALEQLLGRGHSKMLAPVAMESLMCRLFGVPFQEDAPIATISAAFDGLAKGCWVRADPVHLSLQRDEMLLQSNLDINADEAGQFCESMNAHFAGQGLEFFAPHPQRWYVRSETLPRIRTRYLSQATGIDVRRALPAGEEAPLWHQLLNEIQMLLHAHPLNQARENRGEPVINSVWFWGAGVPEGPLQKTYDCASSEEVLVEMLAAAVEIPYMKWSKQWNISREGKQILVWTGLRSALQRGDLGACRIELQTFERNYARPILHALKSGMIAGLQMDILGEERLQRVVLTRKDTRAFWRRTKRLADYSIV
jgi:hypothetical protein